MSTPKPYRAFLAGNGGILVCIALWTLSTAATPAADQVRGKALYENQCSSCHSTWAHTRALRKANSIAELRRRTAAWSTHAGLGWEPADTEDVVEYLNDTFYHFK